LSDPSAVTVRILDREYRIACSAEDRDAVLAASHLLDQKMRQVRDTGKVIGIDRIAVMTALNIAHELLQHRGEEHRQAQWVSARIRALQHRIEDALRAPDG
jgi:cell division protein ZapA